MKKPPNTDSSSESDCDEVCDCDDKTLAWGWKKFKPKCLQWLNSPNWFLFFVCTFTFVQGMSINTFVNVSLPTLEKRFKLTSKQTGFIVASNDITAVILVVFVSFFGSYGHKTKWLGYGAILTGMSVFLFALPKLLIGKYHPEDVSFGGSSLCTPNATRTDIDCNTDSSSFNIYYCIFVISQLMAGAATTPLFSLGPAYLDENVHPKNLSWYLGAFFVCVMLGPGLGSMIAGKLLSVYVDLDMPAGLELTPRDPRWVGAWWLGPFFCGFILIVDGLILLGFPAKLPGSEAVRKNAIEKGYIKKDKIQGKRDMKNLLVNLKDLLTNGTYVFQNFGKVFGAMTGLSIGPFFFKLITQRYGATPFIAGICIALVLVPGTAIGVGIGSYIVKKLGVRDSCRRSAKATFWLQLVVVFGSPLFLIPGCDYSQYAGADVGYHNSSLSRFALSDQCNAGCHCPTTKFRPLCGPDGVSYFSPCFAGCSKHTFQKGFSNCSCANPPLNMTNMARNEVLLVERTCHQHCPPLSLYMFVVGGFLFVAVGFLNVVSGKTVTLRSVSESQRALALGLQFVFLRGIASIPGPVIIGAVIDTTCTLWSSNCGVQENCLNYDFEHLGMMLFLISGPTKVLSVISFGLSWYFCKDSEATTEEKQPIDAKGPDNEKVQTDDNKNNNDSCKDDTQLEPLMTTTTV